MGLHYPNVYTNCRALPCDASLPYQFLLLRFSERVGARTDMGMKKHSAVHDSW
jgi:hypothetical protein